MAIVRLVMLFPLVSMQTQGASERTSERTSECEEQKKTKRGTLCGKREREIVEKVAGQVNAFVRRRLIFSSIPR